MSGWGPGGDVGTQVSLPDLYQFLGSSQPTQPNLSLPPVLISYPMSPQRLWVSCRLERGHSPLVIFLSLAFFPILGICLSD